MMRYYGIWHPKSERWWADASGVIYHVASRAIAIVQGV